MVHHCASAPPDLLRFPFTEARTSSAPLRAAAGDISRSCPRSPRDSQGVASILGSLDPIELSHPAAIPALIQTMRAPATSGRSQTGRQALVWADLRQGRRDLNADRALSIGDDPHGVSQRQGHFCRRHILRRGHRVEHEHLALGFKLLPPEIMGSRRTQAKERYRPYDTRLGSSRLSRNGCPIGLLNTPYRGGWRTLFTNRLYRLSFSRPRSRQSQVKS